MSSEIERSRIVKKNMAAKGVPPIYTSAEERIIPS